MTDNGIATWSGKGIAWNGSLWIAVGSGRSRIASPSSIPVATSTDGIDWFGIAYTQSQTGIAFNYRRPYTLTIALNQTVATLGTVPNASPPIIVPAGSQLDIVSDSYYNSGYTNFSIVLQTHAS